MNKQIQKLYDQADKFASQNRVQNIAAPGNNYFELFHEKFADLIRAEAKADEREACAVLAEKTIWAGELVAKAIRARGNI